MIRTTVVAALVALIGVTAPLDAQTARPAPQQSLTFNPIGLGAGFYSAEYERAVGTNYTVSGGASYFTLDQDISYTAADVRGRFYPTRALEGFALGVSGGVIKIGTDNRTGITFGSTIEHAWLLGASNRTTFSLGGGFKRVVLFGSRSPGMTVFYPTLRTSFGVAF
jgi:hypothetical protein